MTREIARARGTRDLLVHLRRARDHADRHYTEPLDLAQLAAIAGISKYHFQRLFRATYGHHAATYLTERRIERAQDLLRATNLTVTEVCHAVGFSSLGSFSSRFRELVGETPSEFQRRYADGAPRIPGLLRVHVGPGRTRSNRGEARGLPSARSVERMITNISIVSVFVKDVDESLKFYTDVLGFAAGRPTHAGRRLPLVHGRAPVAARAPGCT